MTGPQKRELYSLTQRFNTIGLGAKELARKASLESIRLTETTSLAAQLQRGLARRVTRL